MKLNLESKLKCLTVLACLLSACAARAENHFVFVDGGKAAWANFYRYYNSVRHGYEILRSRGESPIVMATDGTWKVSSLDGGSLSHFALTAEGRASTPAKGSTPSYPPIGFQAQTPDDLVDVIKSLHLKAGDSVTLFMTGHGEATVEHIPELATYCFYRDCYTWKWISDELARLPKDVHIKIATNSCYGGGAEYVARTLPNACVVNSSPYFATNSSGIADESFFSQAFWKRYQSTPPGENTFADLGVYAVRHDLAGNLGSISSLDYVNWVLKTGPYAQPYDDTDGKEVRIDGQNVWRKLLPSGYKDLMFGRKDGESMVPQDDEKAEFLGQLQDLPNDAAALNEASGIWDRIERDAPGQASDPSDRISKALADLRINGERYVEVARSLESRGNELLQQEPMNPAASQSSNRNEAEVAGDYQGKWDEFHKEAESELKDALVDHQIIGMVMKLKRFSEVATPQQKQKLIQLLQCEWEPM